MKKKPAPKKKAPKKRRNIVVYNFDSIKLNNAGLLNDQNINVAYQKFLFEVDNAFNTLFKK
jgi:hypothetical protein